jgi:hypothetical protein
MLRRNMDAYIDVRQPVASRPCFRRAHAMHIALPHMIREIFGLSTPHDEHLLAGADEESVQALGVSQPVLSRFQQDVAVLCPDLVHEAQLGLGRR